jgi:tellurite resistance protein TerC
MTLKRAIIWSCLWIGFSLLCALLIGVIYDSTIAYQFLAGWTIEKALSIDNLFVFLMLFTYFHVEPKAQRRVLNYGIMGVLITRGILIFVGIALINQFEWLMYLLGAVVLYTGVMMTVKNKEEEFDGEKNRIVKFVRKLIPVSGEYHGTKFFVHKHGKRHATPLLVVLIVLELSDVLFSFDSVPAVFSVTRNPLVVYGSNILAVLGLRSLYFLLERMQSVFHYVEKAVGMILLFVGLKMVLPLFFPRFEIGIAVSLAIIVGLLLLGIAASLIFPEKKPAVSAGERTGSKH